MTYAHSNSASYFLIKTNIRGKGRKGRGEGKERGKLLPCAQLGRVEIESHMTVLLWGGTDWAVSKDEDEENIDDFCHVFSLALYTFHCEALILSIVSTYNAISAD